MPAPAQCRAQAAFPKADPISPALEQVISRYASIVRGAARRHDLLECDIDEVFQDVRIRLWRTLSTSEKILAAPASYVYRTAVSAALDLIRRRRARREQELDLISDDLLTSREAQPEEAIEGSQLASDLASALTSLVRSRRVVVQMHLAGYHRSEIAEILGWTEAKTRNLLYRGLSDLRDKLESDEDESGRWGDRRRASKRVRAADHTPGGRRSQRLRTTRRPARVG